MGRALISYGVDTYRVKAILKKDPDGLLEDMLEDDAPWFARCDRVHADLIVLGVPTSREAMSQVLHGKPLDARAGPIYMDVALLLCEYVGQRLPTSPYKRGIPWDTALVDELDEWLDSHTRRPDWFAFSALTHHELGLIEGLATLRQPGAGWLEPEHCEQLDAFFSTLHDIAAQDDEDDDYEERWGQDGHALSHSPQLDEPLCGVVRCLESWVLTCRERGWALATFASGS